MGYFCYRQGTLSELSSACKALTLDPSLVRGWCNLGLVLGRQGRATESYEAFARVIRPCRPTRTWACCWPRMAGSTKRASSFARHWTWSPI